MKIKVKVSEELKKVLDDREMKRKMDKAIHKVGHMFLTLELKKYPPQSSANYPDTERGYYYRRNFGLFRYVKREKMWKSVTISGKAQHAWKTIEKPGKIVLRNVAVSKYKGRIVRLTPYAQYLYGDVPSHMRRIGWRPWTERWKRFRKTFRIDEEVAKILLEVKP